MKHIGLGAKLILLTTFVVLLTSAGLIYFSYQSSYKQLEESIGIRLQSIAATSALMLNGKQGDYHTQIDIENSDRKIRQKQSKTKSFKELRAILRTIQKTNGLEEAIYTFRFSEGTLKFTAMTQKNTYIGDPYKTKDFRAKASAHKAFQDRKATRTGIYRSPNGVWISGHAPFFTSTGKVAGVLAIDIRFETFQKELWAKITRQLLVSLGILIFGLILSVFFSRKLVKRLDYLRASAETISLGELDKSIQIDSHDELGQLAQSLERMRESLKVAMSMLDEDDDF